MAMDTNHEFWELLLIPLYHIVLISSGNLVNI